jgi:hypothetical protein
MLSVIAKYGGVVLGLSAGKMGVSAGVDGARKDDHSLVAHDGRAEGSRPRLLQMKLARVPRLRRRRSIC